MAYNRRNLLKSIILVSAASVLPVSFPVVSEAQDYFTKEARKKCNKARAELARARRNIAKAARDARAAEAAIKRAKAQMERFKRDIKDLKSQERRHKRAYDKAWKFWRVNKNSQNKRMVEKTKKELKATQTKLSKATLNEQNADLARRVAKQKLNRARDLARQAERNRRSANSDIKRYCVPKRNTISVQPKVFERD